MLVFVKINLLVFLSFNILKSYALPVIPDEIAIPFGIENKAAEQIKAVFSSLEKTYNNKTANLWKLKYKQALLLKKKDPIFFCKYMKELSLTPAFPLNQLALVESYELCSFEAPPKFEPKSVPDWLKLRLAEAFYKRRKNFNQPEQTLKATVYLAENNIYKDLRISYLKHALILAKEQNNQIAQQRVTQLLHKESPSLQPNPKAEDYFVVAQDFRENRQFKQAIHFYIKVLNSPKSNFKERNLSFSGLKSIYKIQRNRRKSVQNSEQWAAWLFKENTKQSLALYYKKKLELARQKWNLNENQKAIGLITQLLKDPKSEVIKAEALYLRGLIQLQENHSELSLIDWNLALKILSKKKYKTELTAKVLWKKAWLFRQKKQYKKALESFKRLRKINKNIYTNFKVLFWKGRTYLDLNKKGLARNAFSELIEKDVFGYYGLLAKKILNKKLKIKKEDIIEADLFQNKKVGDLIHWLSALNETELLSFLLEVQKNEILNKKTPTEKEWLKMIWLWLKAKKHLNVFQSLHLMEEDIKKAFFKKYAHLLFPLEFGDEVETASQKWQVDKALIFSIIRQESAFNVRARSPADAFGLMQLIPSTARQTAKRNKISYRNFRDLYRPEKNILLGTAYIKTLLKQYDKNFSFSVSAYNAGSNSVNRWKKELTEFDTLEWIENIPYEETRTYVRLLIRNYVFYYNLLEKQNTNWFPDWIIQ